MTPKVPDVFQTPSFGRQASLLYDITYLLDCLRATFEGFPVITCPKAHQDKRCSYHGTLGPITEDDLPFLCAIFGAILSLPPLSRRSSHQKEDVITSKLHTTYILLVKQSEHERTNP